MKKIGLKIFFNNICLTSILQKPYFCFDGIIPTEDVFGITILLYPWRKYVSQTAQRYA
jgi:hypothetical protein